MGKKAEVFLRHIYQYTFNLFRIKMKFKFLNYFSIFLIQAIVIGQNNKIESLDQRKFIAWEVHHMPYHILVEDAIVDLMILIETQQKLILLKLLNPMNN